MKIPAVLEGFFLEKRRQFAVRTMENYSRIFNQFIEHLGDLEFKQVSTIDIRRHLDHLERNRGLSKRSVYDAWVGLSSFGRGPALNLARLTLYGAKSKRQRRQSKICLPGGPYP